MSEDNTPSVKVLITDSNGVLLEWFQVSEIIPGGTDQQLARVLKELVSQRHNVEEL